MSYSRGRWCTSFVRPSQLGSSPHRHRENEQRQRKVRHQTIGAYAGSFGESAAHHVPAQHALRANEERQRRESREETAWNAAATPEPEKGNQHHETYQASGDAVGPLPPVQSLELRQRDTGVNGLRLGNLQVLLVGPLPGVGSYRRKDSS